MATFWLKTGYIHSIAMNPSKLRLKFVIIFVALVCQHSLAFAHGATREAVDDAAISCRQILDNASKVSFIDIDRNIQNRRRFQNLVDYLSEHFNLQLESESQILSAALEHLAWHDIRTELPDAKATISLKNGSIVYSESNYDLKSRKIEIQDIQNSTSKRLIYTDSSLRTQSYILIENEVLTETLPLNTVPPMAYITPQTKYTYTVNPLPKAISQHVELRNEVPRYSMTPEQVNRLIQVVAEFNDYTVDVIQGPSARKRYVFSSTTTPTSAYVAIASAGEVANYYVDDSELTGFNDMHFEIKDTNIINEKILLFTDRVDTTSFRIRLTPKSTWQRIKDLIRS